MFLLRVIMLVSLMTRGVVPSPHQWVWISWSEDTKVVAILHQIGGGGVGRVFTMIWPEDSLGMTLEKSFTVGSVSSSLVIDRQSMVAKDSVYSGVEVGVIFHPRWPLFALFLIRGFPCFPLEISLSDLTEYKECFLSMESKRVQQAWGWSGWLGWDSLASSDSESGCL